MLFRFLPFLLLYAAFSCLKTSGFLRCICCWTVGGGRRIARARARVNSVLILRQFLPCLYTYKGYFFSSFQQGVLWHDPFGFCNGRRGALSCRCVGLLGLTNWKIVRVLAKKGAIQQIKTIPPAFSMPCGPREIGRRDKRENRRPPQSLSSKP